VCAQLYFDTCKEIGIKLDSDHWNGHVLKLLKTSHEGKVSILWNLLVQTNKTVRNGKPDVMVHDNGKGTCILIDVAISGEINVNKKEAEKILKYKDLSLEIQHMQIVKIKQYQ
jgi:hypothetical protein